MKLAGKLILVFIVTAVAITAIASQITTRKTFDQFQSNQHELAQSLAKQMHLDVVEALRRDDRQQLDRLVRQMGATDTQVRWVWFDDTPSEGQQPQIETLRFSQLRQVVSVTRATPDGRWHLHTYCPIDAAGVRGGGLELTTSLDWIDEGTAQSWIFSIFSLGAIGLLGIGAVMVAGVRWVARPLESLTAKMDRVGRGDFSGDLKLTGHDELTQLAGAVNRMCHQLRDQQEAIMRETDEKIAALTQLRHADRLKTVGRLAAGFAHEVGTPLNVVSGRAGMIAESSLSEQQMRSYARDIKSEADRMAAIVRQLLDFSRQSDSRKERHDLRDVVQQSVLLLQPLARKRQIVIECMLPDRPADARCDFGQLQQVVTNILDNAIQASLDGMSIQVLLERAEPPPSDPESADWVVSVTDYGVGITAEDKERVFEPFFTTKETGKGTGLGMSIAMGIVEDHGGQITVDSLDGQGTCFRVQLPAAVSAS